MTDIVVTDSTPVQLTQPAGSVRQRIVDVSAQAAPFWQPNSYVAANGLTRPTDLNQTGFVFKNAATAGQTGELEPAWPKTSGGTVVDGSLTWTAQTPPAAGSDTVASATWSQVNPPDGTLTITNQTTTPLTAAAFIGGGTSGSVYTVKAAITMASGEIYPVTLLITIE